MSVHLIEKNGGGSILELTVIGKLVDNDLQRLESAFDRLL